MDVLVLDDIFTSGGYKDADDLTSGSRAERARSA